ncbi:MAG: hypothetical protein JNN21_05560, partial [Candidatus Accumulibacter sp.]|nr:hypothetical protein [Accumulibacter sp.]
MIPSTANVRAAPAAASLTLPMTEAFDAKALLATLTELPGVYRMIDGDGQVLYVGKA